MSPFRWIHRCNDRFDIPSFQVENMSRRTKQQEMIHPGTSWFPPQKDHDALLDMLEKDQLLRIAANNKYTIKPSDFEEKPNAEPQQLDVDAENDEACATECRKSAAKQKQLTSKQRRQRLSNMKGELHRQKQRSKEKNEAHELRNLPKLRSEIRSTAKMQKERLVKANERVEKRTADKIVADQIEQMPFQLRAEMPQSMRLMQPEGDLLRELCDNAKAHRFRAPKAVGDDKKRRVKKLTKMVKKKGLV